LRILSRDPVAAVAGDEISGDRVVRLCKANSGRVRDCGASRGVRPDVVPRDDVAAGRESDSGRGVSGDDVAVGIR
jgi:hypothetical protein